MDNVVVTVNGKKSETLSRLMNGGLVTDLEKNEALTRKLEKLRDKFTDKGELDYVKEVDKMSNDDLKKKVLGYAQELERIEDEKANHKELQTARSIVSRVNKSFSDLKKMTQMRMQFVISTLQSRGATLTSEESSKS